MSIIKELIRHTHKMGQHDNHKMGQTYIHKMGQHDTHFMGHLNNKGDTTQ
jgi:hypothetical protein